MTWAADALHDRGGHEDEVRGRELDVEPPASAGDEDGRVVEGARVEDGMVVFEWTVTGAKSDPGHIGDMWGCI